MMKLERRKAHRDTCQRGIGRRMLAIARDALKSNALTLGLCFTLTVFLVFLTVYSTHVVRVSLKTHKVTVENHLKPLASLAANIVSIEELEQITGDADMGKAVYADARKRLHEFSQQWGLQFTYYMRAMPDGRFQYIVNNSHVPELSGDLNGFFTIGDEPKAKVTIGGEIVSETAGGVYIRDWEGIVSGYAPVYDGNGEIYCIVGVDLKDDSIRQSEKQIYLLQFIQLATLFILIGAGIRVVLIYRDKVKASLRASRAKSEFLSNMSHEMRTPMNAILGMTAIAKVSCDLDKKDYCLDNIDTAAAHMLGVINDVLDISKIESDKFKISMECFDFERMLQKVISIIHFQAEERRQEFKVCLEDDVPRFLIADDQRLTQVLTNLLYNAVKFTPNEGVITLSARHLQESEGVTTVLLSVADTGIGITKEQQSRLFDFFEQADSSTSRRFGGTGLGLAISKRIVEMMGGRIWVESTPEQGSVFSFTIQAKTVEDPPEETPDSGMNLSTIRVLATCVAPEVQNYFVQAARRTGFSYDICASSEQACALIEKNDVYDAVFIDGKIPDIAQLIECVKNAGQSGQGGKQSQIAAIVSSLEWEILSEKFGNNEIDHFLSKPIIPYSITDCLHSCFGTHTESQKQETEEYGFPGRRVLLAEDMEINQDIVKALLEPTHLEIVCAGNGVEAVKFFSESPEKYDIIFMDVQMPEMDGYTATRRIRALNVPNARTIPIIAMTANVFREDVEECIAAGMDDHIGKPIVFEEVMKKLREYLE